MFFEEQSEVDQWWGRREYNAPFPGKLTLFLGAGISMDAPTKLPSGMALTKDLLKLLVSERALNEILQTTSQCSHVTKRPVPRLEHILDIACNGPKICSQSDGQSARELLRLFSSRDPNANHHLISQFLKKNRAWAITTNFDTCIEKAANFQIPVHVLNAESGEIEIRHLPDADWGLIKIHGTIDNDVGGLAATLKDLVGGLPQPYESLLERVFDESDLVVVAGYSGTDHFDVNRWIRSRMNAKSKARLIWLCHGEKNDDSFAQPEWEEPNASWGTSFNGRITLKGPTTAYLSQILGEYAPSDLPLSELGPESSLFDQLATLYRPNDAQRHLNGALMAMAMGLGQLAEEELDDCEELLGDDQALRRFRPVVGEQRGRYLWALLVQLLLACKERRVDWAYIARILRKSQKPFAAIATALIATIRPVSDEGGNERAAAMLDGIASVLAYIQSKHHSLLFATKLSRRIARWWLTRLFNRLVAVADHRSAHSLEGLYQRLRLWEIVLLRNVDDDMFRSIWVTIDRQMSTPDVYTRNGPLVPGFYLTALSTLNETDRLGELAEAYVGFAEILTMLLWRQLQIGTSWYLKLFRIPFLFERFRKRHGMAFPEYALLIKYLDNADDIAKALQEPHWRIMVARARVRADELLGGLTYFHPQRVWKVRRPQWQSKTSMPNPGQIS